MKKELPRPAEKDEQVSIDLEMFGQDRERLHRPHGQFACLTISYNPRDTYQVYTLPDLRESLKRIDKGLWIGHNLLYDIRQLRRFVDIPFRQVWDTMLVEQGMFGGWYMMFGLRDLSRRWLNAPMDKEIVKEFSGRTRMTQAMERYAVKDTVTTLKVAQAQQEYIEEEDIDMRHYWDVDEPAMWAILDMPPVTIDVDGWFEFAEWNRQEGERIEGILGINVFSHIQVKDAIEGRLGTEIKNTNKDQTLLPLIMKLKRSSHHNDERDAKFIETVLEARKYRKRYSTYGERWVETHVEDGNKVYADWKNNGAETARMACRQPNLMNIPKKEGPQFRELFLASFPSGCMLISDQKQQELRIMAAQSGDPALRAAILEGHDLHAEAAKDFNLPHRDDGKKVNFGLSYGMSPYGLSNRVGITETEAMKGIRRRKRRYPETYKWSQKMENRARSLERVVSVNQRRIWVNTYGTQWKRNAINAPIQGSAAEQTKTWLWMVHRRALDQGLPFRIALAVHDELVADIGKGEARAYKKLLKECGEESGVDVGIDFPMEVETVKGKTWRTK